MDSVESASMLQRYKDGKSVLSLVSYIVKLVGCFEHVRFQHTLRCGNAIVDAMAKLVYINGLVCHHFLAPPTEIARQVELELVGVSF
ncbi:hypothetical protein V6N11_076728 [Hibiscus sabdariffa]